MLMRERPAPITPLSPQELYGAAAFDVYVERSCIATPLKRPPLALPLPGARSRPRLLLCIPLYCP